jgi:hypothetical protein
MQIFKDDITVIVGPAADEISVLMGGTRFVLTLAEGRRLQNAVGSALRQIIAAQGEDEVTPEAEAEAEVNPEKVMSSLMDFMEAELKREPLEIPSFLRAGAN